MLSISDISDADYYLGDGSGCCAHAETSTDGAAGYYVGPNGEPPGRWVNRGPNALGLEGAIHAEGPSGDAFRAMVNHLRHPTTGKVLGVAPQRFKSADERVAAWQRRYPDATPEQVAEYRMRTLGDTRSAKHAWDLTFSPPKSWSVLHAALAWAGRHDEAEQLWACLEAGVEAALTHVHDELAYIQSKPTGPETGDRRTARYERAVNLQMAAFRHHTSREGDPQLHVHVMLLNRALNAAGAWRALYSPAFYRAKHGADAIFLRVAEAEAMRRLGLAFAATPEVDDTGASIRPAREIVGVSDTARRFFSSRDRTLSEAAQEELDAYEAAKGHKASQRTRYWIRQAATLATRRPKSGTPPTPEERVERWEEAFSRDTAESCADVLEATDAARVRAGEPRVVPVYDPEVVIGQALADLDRSCSVWNLSKLVDAINLRLPDMIADEPAEIAAVLNGLAARAIRSRRVVSVEAPAAVPLPDSLTDSRSGRSVFEAPDGRRFTCRSTVEREGSLVARLDVRGAPRVSPTRAEQLVGGSRLSAEQNALVRAVLTSGLRVEVVDAAPGTGKTTTARELSRAVSEQWGVGVHGFTIAEKPAQVLRGQGVSRAHNIAAFLDYLDRESRDEVSDAERASFAVARGSYVIVDEASTVDTLRLVALVEALEALGVGKIILVGDRAQADPVDAGGAFAMLVDELERRRRDALRAARALPPSTRDADEAAMAAWTTPVREAEPAPVHRLRQVRRFDRSWERAASARLRDGDVAALADYETRGRLRGDTDRTTVRAAAVDGFVRDYLSDRDSIIVTATTEEASAAADRVRSRLVEHGYVEADGVDLRDGSIAGVGDMVQTRLNDRDVGVLNREQWQVVARADDGALEVRPALGRDEHGQQRWGDVVALPPVYVRTQVELAYAATVHAVEGVTIDGGTAHTIVSRAMPASHVLVGSTRATSGNYLHVELAESPAVERARSKVLALEHRVADAVGPARAAAQGALDDARRALAAREAEAETPVGRVASILSRDDHAPAARTTIAVEADRATHLGHLGPQWEYLVRETRAASHRDALRSALGPDADAVLADPAVSRLYGLIRGAELSGHEPAELIDAALRHPTSGRRWTLLGTRSPASALYARLAEAMAVGPLPRPVPGTFESRTPHPTVGDVENARLDAARRLGRAMDDRAAVLGERAALDAPEWAVRALGPVPDDVDGRAVWVGRVSTAAAYRERYGIDEESTALGRRPTHADPERGWWWDNAAKLLGVPEHERLMATVSDGDLANRIQEWERVQSWMPRNVDADLHETWDELLAAQAAAVEARGTDAEVDAEAATLALADRVAALEEIAEHRARVYAARTEVRERAEEARMEVRRRQEAEVARGGPHPDDPGPTEPDDVEPDIPAPRDPIDEPAPWDAVDAVAAVFAWASARPIPADTPDYGSPDWAALPPGDPRRVAARDAAALAWFRVGEPYSPDEIADMQARVAEARGVLDLDSAPDGVVYSSEVNPRRNPDGSPIGPDVVVDLDSWRTPVVDADPVDVDVLRAVMDDTGPLLYDGDVPELGSRAWVDADAEGRDAGVALAALKQWNLGDPLDELAARSDAAGLKETAVEVSTAIVEQREAARRERVALEAAERRATAELDAAAAARGPVDASPEEAALVDAYDRGEPLVPDAPDPEPEAAAPVVWPDVVAPPPDPTPAAPEPLVVEAEPEPVVVEPEADPDAGRRRLVEMAREYEARNRVVEEPDPLPPEPDPEPEAAEWANDAPVPDVEPQVEDPEPEPVSAGNEPEVADRDARIREDLAAAREAADRVAAEEAQEQRDLEDAEQARAREVADAEAEFVDADLA